MKRKNKKGFTLIELLAVIVILAIIALIAVPVVMNIITKARKSAFKDSAYGIIKAGELYYADRLLEPNGMVDNKIFTFPNDAAGLEIKGSKPSKGRVVVTKEGKVAIGITDGKYCITKGYDDTDVTVTEDVENCEFPVLTLSELAVNVTDSNAKACLKKGTQCSVVTDAGTKFTIRVNDEQTKDFYVLADDGNKVTLIMNQNVGSNVAWYAAAANNSYGPITALTELQSQTNGWTNLPEMVIDKFETESAQKTLSQSFRMYARLPKYSETNVILRDNGGTIPKWLSDIIAVGGSLWTSTANSSDTFSAYVIEYQNITGSSVVVSHSGVRPVIELYK